MTTQSPSSGSLPHQSLMSRKTHRFRQRLKGNVNADECERLPRSDPKDDLEICGPTKTDTSQENERPSSVKHTISVERMRSFSRTQDLASKHEKLIQKRQQRLLIRRVPDPAEPVDMQRKVHQVDSMLNSDGFSTSDFGSFGALTMSEDILDGTSYSSDAVVDAIVDRQMMEAHSDEDEDEDVHTESHRKYVQGSKSGQLRRKSLTRVLSRGRVLKISEQQSSQSLVATSFDTLDSSRHTLDDSRHDSVGKPAQDAEKTSAVIERRRKTNAAHGVARMRTLKSKGKQPIFSRSFISNTNISFDTLDNSCHSVDGGSHGRTVPNCSETDETPYNQSHLLPVDQGIPSAQQDFESCVSASFDTLDDSCHTVTDEASQMAEKSFENLRQRVSKGLSRVRSHRRNVNNSKARNASRLNNIASGDKNEDSALEINAEVKNRCRAAPIPEMMVESQYHAVGGFSSTMLDNSDVHLAAGNVSVQIEDTSVQFPNDSVVSRDDIGPDEYLKGKRIQPPTPESAIRTSFFPSPPDEDGDSYSLHLDSDKMFPNHVRPSADSILQRFKPDFHEKSIAVPSSRCSSTHEATTIPRDSSEHGQPNTEKSPHNDGFKVLDTEPSMQISNSSNIGLPVTTSVSFLVDSDVDALRDTQEENDPSFATVPLHQSVADAALMRREDSKANPVLPESFGHHHQDEALFIESRHACFSSTNQDSLTDHRPGESNSEGTPDLSCDVRPHVVASVVKAVALNGNDSFHSAPIDVKEYEQIKCAHPFSDKYLFSMESIGRHTVQASDSPNLLDLGTDHVVESQVVCEEIKRDNVVTFGRRQRILSFDSALSVASSFESIEDCPLDEARAISDARELSRRSRRRDVSPNDSVLPSGLNPIKRMMPVVFPRGKSLERAECTDNQERSAPFALSGRHHPTAGTVDPAQSRSENQIKVGTALAATSASALIYVAPEESKLMKKLSASAAKDRNDRQLVTMTDAHEGIHDSALIDRAGDTSQAHGKDVEKDVLALTGKTMSELVQTVSEDPILMTKLATPTLADTAVQELEFIARQSEGLHYLDLSEMADENFQWQGEEGISDVVQGASPAGIDDNPSKESMLAKPFLHEDSFVQVLNSIRGDIKVADAGDFRLALSFSEQSESSALLAVRTSSPVPVVTAGLEELECEQSLHHPLTAESSLMYDTSRIGFDAHTVPKNPDPEEKPVGIQMNSLRNISPIGSMECHTASSLDRTASFLLIELDQDEALRADRASAFPIVDAASGGLLVSIPVGLTAPAPLQQSSIEVTKVDSSGSEAQCNIGSIDDKSQAVGTPPPPPPPKQRHPHKKGNGVVSDVLPSGTVSMLDSCLKRNEAADVGILPPPPPPPVKKRCSSGMGKEFSALDIDATLQVITIDEASDPAVRVPDLQQCVLPYASSVVERNRLKDDVTDNVHEVASPPPLQTGHVQVRLIDVPPLDDDENSLHSHVEEHEINQPMKVVSIDTKSTCPHHYPDLIVYASASPRASQNVSLSEPLQCVVHDLLSPVESEHDCPPFPDSPGLVLDSTIFFKKPRDELYHEYSAPDAEDLDTISEGVPLTTVRPCFSVECSALPRFNELIAMEDAHPKSSNLEGVIDGHFDPDEMRRASVFSDAHRTNNLASVIVNDTEMISKVSKSYFGDTNEKPLVRTDYNSRDEEMFAVVPGLGNSTRTPLSEPQISFDKEWKCSDVDHLLTHGDYQDIFVGIVDAGLTNNQWDTRSIVAFPPDVTLEVSPFDPAAWDASRVIFDSNPLRHHDGSNWTESPTQDSAQEASVQSNDGYVDYETYFPRLLPECSDMENVDVEDSGTACEAVESLLGGDGRNAPSPGHDVTARLSQQDRIDEYNKHIMDSSSSDSEDAEDDYDSENDAVQFVPDYTCMILDSNYDSDSKNEDVYEDVASGIRGDNVSGYHNISPTFCPALAFAEGVERHRTSHLAEGDGIVPVFGDTPSLPSADGASDVFIPSTVERVIPLLAPPPEEKMNKWSQSKLHLFRHLQVDTMDPTIVLSRVCTEVDDKLISTNCMSPAEPDHVFVDSDVAEVIKEVVIDKVDQAFDVDGGTNESNHETLKWNFLSLSRSKTIFLASDDPETSKEIPLDTDGQAFASGRAISNISKSFIKTNFSPPSESENVFLEGDDTGEREFVNGATDADADLFPTLLMAKLHHVSSLCASDIVESPTSACPGLGKIVIGEKMAEKFAFASSVAAEKLEECLVASKSSASLASSSIERIAREEKLSFWLQSLLGQCCECTEIFALKSDLRSLLEDDHVFEHVCTLVAATVTDGLKSILQLDGRNEDYVTFSLRGGSQRPAVVAANFVSFVQRVGNLTRTLSPFEKDNPFIMMVVGESMVGTKVVSGSVQQLVFDHGGADAVEITGFFYEAVRSANQISQTETAAPGGVSKDNRTSRRYEKPPENSPNPFESATAELPNLILVVLSFLGDPVAVCRMKIVNRGCMRVIFENEHSVMRDAVRTGGMSMNVRPAFWMWITLEKCVNRKAEKLTTTNDDHDQSACGLNGLSKIAKLSQQGNEGPWHGVIKRDVTRAFGNMPPHKTGAKLRADSIVRALVTFGHGRVIKRGVKGGGFSAPTPSMRSSGGYKSKSKPSASTAPAPWEVGDDNSNASDLSLTPTDTVCEWGGVSPVASFASSLGDDTDNRKPLAVKENGLLESPENGTDQTSIDASREVMDDFVLNGNALTTEMKLKLQNQLQFILHALAAKHEEVGYCQGMDYIVAHLLRVLQDTVKWHAAKGWLPRALDDVTTALREQPGGITDDSISESLVVEEAVFRVMDCLFTTYNLRHMFWPELRSLKICCRVFERLVQQKLPVLADHFEHHELNVGLFALGWFQTIFLYLPSMPTATVCHIWDIWLVERSYKIFFRVGTAILFLSQPILLNHDLEGMMTYLNTFPDATLLKSDILIACALQIKVTNTMLTELEMDLTGGY